MLFHITRAAPVITPNSDTWVWDGTNWTQMLPQDSPSGRAVVCVLLIRCRTELALARGRWPSVC